MALDLSDLKDDDTTVTDTGNVAPVVKDVGTSTTSSFLSGLENDGTSVATGERVDLTPTAVKTPVQDTSEQGIQLQAKESEDPFSPVEWGIPKDAQTQIRTEEASLKHTPLKQQVLSGADFMKLPRDVRMRYVSSLGEDDLKRFMVKMTYGEPDKKAIRPEMSLSTKDFDNLTVYQQYKYINALNNSEKAVFYGNRVESDIAEKRIEDKKGIGEKILDTTKEGLLAFVGIGEIVAQGVGLVAGYMSSTLINEGIGAIDYIAGTHIAKRELALRSAKLIPVEQRSPWFNELIKAAASSTDEGKSYAAISAFMKQNPPTEEQARELSNAANRMNMEDNTRYVWPSQTPLAKAVENITVSAIEATQHELVDPKVKSLATEGKQESSTLLQQSWNTLLNHFPILGAKSTLNPVASVVKKIQDTPFTAKQKSAALDTKIKQEIERIDAEKMEHVKERIDQNAKELEQLDKALKEADADIAKYSKAEVDKLGYELYEAAKKARQDIVNEMDSRRTNIDALSGWHEAYDSPKAPRAVVEEHVRQTRLLSSEVAEAVTALNKAIKEVERPDYADIVAYRSEQLRIVRDTFHDAVDQVHQSTGSMKDVMTEMQAVNRMLMDADFPLRRYANLDLDTLSVKDVKKGLDTGAIDPRDLSAEQLIKQAGETTSAEKAVLERMTTESQTRQTKPVEQTQLPSDQPQAQPLGNTQAGAATPAQLANIATLGTGKAIVNAAKGVYALGSAIGYKWLFAHSSKIRSFGTETAKKIADMFSTPLSEKKTPTGFTVTKHDVFNRQRVANGKFESRLNNIMDSFSGYLGKTPGKINKEVWKLLHGFNAVASKTALDARVKLRGFLNDVHTYMNEAGIKVAFNVDYMPIRYLDKKIARNKDAFIKDLVHTNASWINKAAKKHNTTPLAIATEIADRIIREDGVPGTFKSINPSFKQTTGAQMRAGYSRKLIKDEAFLNKWSDTDLKSVLSNYVRKSTQRAEHARTFGEHGEILKPLVDQLKIEMKNSGRKIDEVDSAIYDAADSVLGIYGRMDATLAGKSTDLVRQARMVNNGLYAWLTFATMTKVAITSLAEIPTAVVRHGIHRFPMAFIKATGYALHQVARKGLAIAGMKDLLPKSKALQYLESIGQISSSHILADILSDRYTTGSSKAVGIFYKGVGLEGITNFTKVLAYHASRAEMNAQLKYANRPVVMRMIQSGDFTLGSFLENRRAKNAAKELAEFGYDVNDIKQLARGLDHIPAGISEAVDHAFAKVGDRTVLRPSPVSRPLWKSKEIAKTVGMLTAFTDAFANIFIKKAFLDLADIHVTFPKRLAAIVPGLSLIAFIAYLSGVLKSHITGDNDPTEDFEDGISHVFKSLDAGGIFGHASKALPFLYDKKASVRFKATNTVFGPGPSSVIDMLGAGFSNAERLSKTAARFTPGLNVFKDVREDTAEAYRNILEGFMD